MLGQHSNARELYPHFDDLCDHTAEDHLLPLVLAGRDVASALTANILACSLLSQFMSTPLPPSRVLGELHSSMQVLTPVQAVTECLVRIMGKVRHNSFAVRSHACSQAGSVVAVGVSVVLH